MTSQNEVETVTDVGATVQNARSNRRWKILLVAAGVAIVGLIVAIIVVNVMPRSKYPPVSDGDTSDQNPVVGMNSATAAYDLYTEITKKVGDGNGYTVEDGVADFEKALDEGDNMWKLYIAIYFASFVYNRYGDAARSVKIIESVKDAVYGDNGKVYEYFLNQYETEAKEREQEL